MFCLTGLVFFFLPFFAIKFYQIKKIPASNLLIDKKFLWINFYQKNVKNPNLITMDQEPKDNNDIEAIENNIPDCENVMREDQSENQIIIQNDDDEIQS